MRFLADENIHPLVVRSMRAAGHDVEWIMDSSPGVTDSLILDRADIAELVLITFDRDFGDLIFNRGYPAPLAILYSRLDRRQPQFIAGRFLEVVNKGLPARHLITITANKERLKPFPPGA